ncbi:MAG: glycosyltransferase family 2 protein [Nitrospirae bacterium]|nr:glycosyltransferase family 2 protein [Nitrospirota bacterium]
MVQEQIKRSLVIPVLDFSPHSEFNIRTLLNDLDAVEGEVICIFNTKEVYDELKSHPRIDKYCYNKLNAGVSRSWNMGINLAEGSTISILNADLHVEASLFDELESYLFSLENAVIVGPQGSYIDFSTLSVAKYFEKGNFSEPVRTNDVSGFLFTIHAERFLRQKLMFDIRFSPCFFEEWDMGIQIMQAGLACYAVPVVGFEHHWGVSKGSEVPISYFGRDITRDEALLENRNRFIKKWYSIFASKSE